jgi:hypothetical protein
MTTLEVSKYIELLKIYYVVILWYFLNKNLNVLDEGAWEAQSV